VLKRVVALLRGFWGRSAFSEIGGSLEEFALYWRVYGGLGAILSSPALWLAVLFTWFSANLWQDCKWFDISISIIPSLLGFTIAALAIVLAFPSTKLFVIIREDGRDDSYYMDTAARFVHFTFVQVIALLLALLGHTYHGHVLAFFGILFLVYSVIVAFMTALNFLSVAFLFNKFRHNSDE
jgi:hypothetical protein